MTQTVRETWLAAQKRIADSLELEASETKFEAQLLLQTALNVNRAWLLSHENDALRANIHAHFEALLLRRLQGEPIAYILGQREFYGLNLIVTPDTLIPRPDTETLVEAALVKIPASKTTSTLSFRRRSESSDLQKADYNALDSDLRQNDNVNVLDLGTGSGAIGLAIAKNRPHANVVAVDASSSALEVARKNALNLQIPNVQFLLSDWFSALDHQRFDVIVSNPPYVEQNDSHLSQGDLRFEPMSALASGADGLDDIRRILADCLIHLNPQGWLMLEHGYNQAEAVADSMAEIGLIEIQTLKDLGDNNRVTIGKNPLIVSTHWS